MAWWAAAALAPMVIDAFNGSDPKMPKYRPGPALPDRSSHIHDLLRSASSPNHQLWQLASDAAMERVNRMLHRSGLGGSSIGAQIQASMASQLAAQFLENELQRKRDALGMVLNYDIQATQGNRQAHDSAYQAQLLGYQNQMGQRRAQDQMWGNLASGLANTYGQHENRQYLNQQRQEDRDWYRELMTQSLPQPQVGVPYSHNPQMTLP